MKMVFQNNTKINTQCLYNNVNDYINILICKSGTAQLDLTECKQTYCMFVWQIVHRGLFWIHFESVSLNKGMPNEAAVMLLLSTKQKLFPCQINSHGHLFYFELDFQSYSKFRADRIGTCTMLPAS